MKEQTNKRVLTTFGVLTILLAIAFGAWVFTHTTTTIRCEYSGRPVACPLLELPVNSTGLNLSVINTNWSVIG